MSAPSGGGGGGGGLSSSPLYAQRRAVQQQMVADTAAAAVEAIATNGSQIAEEIDSPIVGFSTRRRVIPPPVQVGGAGKKQPHQFDFLSLRTGSVANSMAAQAALADARESGLALMALSPTAAGLHAHVASQDSATVASNAERILREAAATIAAESEARVAAKSAARQTRYVMGDSDPLIKACKRGDDERVRELLASVEPEDLNDYVNGRDKNGSTPIFHTVWPGHLEALRVLLENGADPNKQNNRHNTALHLACEREHHALILLLIQFGGHITLGNLEGKRCFAMVPDAQGRARMENFVKRALNDVRSSRGARPGGAEEYKLDVGVGGGEGRGGKPAFLTKRFYERSWYDGLSKEQQRELQQSTSSSQLLGEALAVPRDGRHALPPPAGAFFNTFLKERMPGEKTVEASKRKIREIRERETLQQHQKQHQSQPHMLSHEQWQMQRMHHGPISTPQRAQGHDRARGRYADEVDHEFGQPRFAEAEDEEEEGEEEWYQQQSYARFPGLARHGSNDSAQRSYASEEEGEGEEEEFGVSRTDGLAENHGQQQQDHPAPQQQHRSPHHQRSQSHPLSPIPSPHQFTLSRVRSAAFASAQSPLLRSELLSPSRTAIPYARRADMVRPVVAMMRDLSTHLSAAASDAAVGGTGTTQRVSERTGRSRPRTSHAASPLQRSSRPTTATSSSPVSHHHSRSTSMGSALSSPLRPHTSTTPSRSPSRSSPTRSSPTSTMQHRESARNLLKHPAYSNWVLKQLSAVQTIALAMGDAPMPEHTDAPASPRQRAALAAADALAMDVHDPELRGLVDVEVEEFLRRNYQLDSQHNGNGDGTQLQAQGQGQGQEQPTLRDFFAADLHPLTSNEVAAANYARATANPDLPSTTAAAPTPPSRFLSTSPSVASSTMPASSSSRFPSRPPGLNALARQFLVQERESYLRALYRQVVSVVAQVKKSGKVHISPALARRLQGQSKGASTWLRAVGFGDLFSEPDRASAPAVQALSLSTGGIRPESASLPFNHFAAQTKALFEQQVKAMIEERKREREEQREWMYRQREGEGVQEEQQQQRQHQGDEEESKEQPPNYRSPTRSPSAAALALAPLTSPSLFASSRSSSNLHPGSPSRTAASPSPSPSSSPVHLSSSKTRLAYSQSATSLTLTGAQAQRAKSSQALNSATMQRALMQQYQPRARNAVVGGGGYERQGPFVPSAGERRSRPVSALHATSGKKMLPQLEPHSSAGLADPPGGTTYGGGDHKSSGGVDRVAQELSLAMQPLYVPEGAPLNPIALSAATAALRGRSASRERVKSAQRPPSSTSQLKPLGLSGGLNPSRTTELFVELNPVSRRSAHEQPVPGSLATSASQAALGRAQAQGPARAAAVHMGTSAGTSQAAVKAPPLMLEGVVARTASVASRWGVTEPAMPNRSQEESALDVLLAVGAHAAPTPALVSSSHSPNARAARHSHHRSESHLSASFTPDFSNLVHSADLRVSASAQGAPVPHAAASSPPPLSVVQLEAIQSPMPASLLHNRQPSLTSPPGATTARKVKRREKSVDAMGHTENASAAAASFAAPSSPSVRHSCTAAYTLTPSAHVWPPTASRDEEKEGTGVVMLPFQGRASYTQGGRMGSLSGLPAAVAPAPAPAPARSHSRSPSVSRLHTSPSLGSHTQYRSDAWHMAVAPMVGGQPIIAHIPGAQRGTHKRQGSVLQPDADVPLATSPEQSHAQPPSPHRSPAATALDGVLHTGAVPRNPSLHSTAAFHASAKGGGAVSHAGRSTHGFGGRHEPKAEAEAEADLDRPSIFDSPGTYFQQEPVSRTGELQRTPVLDLARLSQQ